MISRVFSVDRADGSELLQFKGFDQRFHTGRTPELVALVREVDCVVAYALDDNDLAKQEFARYLLATEDEQCGERTPLGFYRKEVSLG